MDGFLKHTRRTAGYVCVCMCVCGGSWETERNMGKIRQGRGERGEEMWFKWTSKEKIRKEKEKNKTHTHKKKNMGH